MLSLEMALKAAADAVAFGLRSRIAYREAAGWLAYSHVWIHPWDLALRDASAIGSYFPAMFSGHLAAQLPTTTAEGLELRLRRPMSPLIARFVLRGSHGVWRR